MVYVETTTSLENFRMFLINSTCRSFIPESYLRDKEVFPEKDELPGYTYIEAVDKVTLKKVRHINFVSAKGVLGIIYVSKSGNTKLKWRHLEGSMGKVSGEASPNSLVNLMLSMVLTKDYVEELIKGEKTD